MGRRDGMEAVLLNPQSEHIDSGEAVKNGPAEGFHGRELPGTMWKRITYDRAPRVHNNVVCLFRLLRFLLDDDLRSPSSRRGMNSGAHKLSSHI